MDPRSLSCSIAQVDYIYPAEKFLVSKQPTFERWLSSGAQGHGAPRLVKGGDCAWSKSRPPQLQETVMLPWPTLTPSVVVAPAGAKSDPPPPPFPFAGLAATPCQQNVPPLAPPPPPKRPPPPPPPPSWAALLASPPAPPCPLPPAVPVSPNCVVCPLVWHTLILLAGRPPAPPIVGVPPSRPCRRRTRRRMRPSPRWVRQRS